MPIIDQIKADLGLTDVAIRVEVRHMTVGGEVIRHGRSYLIRLNKKVRGSGRTRTLAHELRHIWQEERGLLTFSADGTPYWMGVPQAGAYETWAHEQDARAYDARWSGIPYE